MRRTWNSWTHYRPDGGPDWEPAHDEAADAREPRCGQNEGSREPAERGGPGRGRLESAFAQSMADALERAMDLCDVRNERVARVKSAIEAGTYRVPARELAQKLVKNMLGEYR